MKKARRIELYDAGVLLGDIEGMFAEYGEMDKFTVNGDDLEKFYEVLRLDVSNFSYTAFSRKEQKKVTHVYPPNSLDFTINHVLNPCFWKTDEKIEIQAEVISSNLLELLLTWEEGFSRQITYSGRFAVEWEGED